MPSDVASDVAIHDAVDPDVAAKQVNRAHQNTLTLRETPADLAAFASLRRALADFIPTSTSMFGAASTPPPPFLSCEEAVHCVVSHERIYIDLWGCLHDGSRPLPGALELLETLKRKGREVLLVSNSALSSVLSRERLKSIGIPPELYNVCMTSGEEVRYHFNHRLTPFFQQDFRCVTVVSPQPDPSILPDGLAITDRPEEGDLLLLSQISHLTPQETDNLINTAVKRNLPIICANPDLVSLSPDGQVKPCPGEVALRLERTGLAVSYHGKPWPLIHVLARAALPKGHRTTSSIVIGDSMIHDIGSACLAGLPSLLLTSGIHRQDLHHDPDNSRLADWKAFAANFAYQPTWLAPGLKAP